MLKLFHEKITFYHAKSQLGSTMSKQPIELSLVIIGLLSKTLLHRVIPISNMH